MYQCVSVYQYPPSQPRLSSSSTDTRIFHGDSVCPHQPSSTSQFLIKVIIILHTINQTLQMLHLSLLYCCIVYVCDVQCRSHIKEVQSRIPVKKHKMLNNHPNCTVYDIRCSSHSLPALVTSLAVRWRVIIC